MVIQKCIKDYARNCTYKKRLVSIYCDNNLKQANKNISYSKQATADIIIK